MLRLLPVALCITVAHPAITAHAHMLHQQEATLRLDGDKGYLAVAVPAAAFLDVDDNADGLLGPEEIAAHQDKIIRQFKTGFRVSAPDGPALLEFAWVTNPSDAAASNDPNAPTPYVIIMAGARFSAPPARVAIETGLFGDAPGEQFLNLRVRRGDDIETGVLRAGAPAYEFFADRN